MTITKPLPTNTNPHVVFFPNGRWDLAYWSHYDHGEYRWFWVDSDTSMSKDVSDGVTDWVSLDDLVAAYQISQ